MESNASGQDFWTPSRLWPTASSPFASRPAKSRGTQISGRWRRNTVTKPTQSVASPLFYGVLTAAVMVLYNPKRLRRKQSSTNQIIGPLLGTTDRHHSLPFFSDLPVALLSNFVFKQKHIFDGLKAYLRPPMNHIYSNIRDRLAKSPYVATEL
jgi:hypothetical protein